MAITLQMPPRLEARVREEAAREGIDPGTLVVRAVEKQLAPQGGPMRVFLSRSCCG